MKKTIFFALLILQFVCSGLFASNPDSLLFINDVKQFLFKECDFEIPDLYTTWERESKPYIYLFVSKSDSIACPNNYKRPFNSFGSDEEGAKKKEAEFIAQGYHTLCYKTYGSSSTKLTTPFLAYPKEAIAFIIFHEYMHNYLGYKNIALPYDFIEALCDVIGNYGTLNYSRSSKMMNITSAKDQIKLNEKIYTCFNSYIKKINTTPAKSLAFDLKCNKIVIKLLKRANAFQNDRFNYKVNNAYLIKNKNYSQNYFLLKKVLMKQKTMKDFLEIIKTLPGNEIECKKALEKFT